MGNNTPSSLGFHMPAEWELHSATWLAWPYDETTFPNRIPAAEAVFVKIIETLHNSETVKLLVTGEETKQHAEKLLRNAKVDIQKIKFIITKFSDVWIRDYGPTFLVNPNKKALGWVKWEYNGYGKADDPYFTPVLVDNEVFNNIQLPGTKFEPNIVMEGGSIETNGKGSLITTEQCLLNPNRNPNLTKSDLEQYLKNYLGVDNIIWLKKGLFNDHTDGHVDDIAKFAGPNKILTAYEENKSDENFEILNDNYKVLVKARDSHGKPFEVIKVPMPHMRYDPGHTVHSENPEENLGNPQGSEKAAASYMNFYIGNKVLLVPAFSDVNDAKALAIIQRAFPNRKAIGIDCREIIYGGGTIHCMSQQEPLI